MAAIQTTIQPCLWFDGQAEAAAQFYMGIFPGSRKISETRFTEAGQEVHGQKPGSVMTVEFELLGQRFVALNGGPLFKFSEAVSFQVLCNNQQEVDRYWNALSQGGDPEAQQCGWLKDQFGLSWQVVPRRLLELTADPDAAKVRRTLDAMFPMKKMDIAALERAALAPAAMESAKAQP